ncbi:hypothetical protein OB919_11285 [Halobacteria archaeon AArc-curdl1]|uniref:Uncharacterized protein n=1 Tax=Natronosalvus hydrolyticus TaxID=2979988 RepID=A0AAP2Z8A6_9EURY|nr:hypothetical protein [Halobacteria archaeon AArc-curdl1]
MIRRRSSAVDGDSIVCADVLGRFGVEGGDLRAQHDSERLPGEESAELETVLETALDDARDRTTFLRRTISGSPRGIDCSARYSQETLERELTAAFESIEWTVTFERSGFEWRLRATDPAGRSRETTLSYPKTPLERDNLPAILHQLESDILYGTDAGFVLLSRGVDRWRAALVDETALEAVRADYGERIEAFDRPLLPAASLEAYASSSSDAESYTPGSSDEAVSPGDDSHWPEWALERSRRRGHSELSGPSSGSTTDSSGVGNSIDGAKATPEASLIEEAEPTGTRDKAAKPTDGRDEAVESTTETPVWAGDEGDSLWNEESEPARDRARERDGYVLSGGSPTVSRSGESCSGNSRKGDSSKRTGLANETGRSDSANERIGTHAANEPADTHEASGPTSTDDGFDAARSRKAASDRAATTDDDGFGSLSGSVGTTRVSNESFGTGETQDEDEQYLALGAAMGTGQNVSVSGLLEDDSFLPELPAVEPTETRVAFEETFDPAALPKARAAAEQSGFVWVQSGGLETTRVSNG